jgi:predicted nucleic acid-binding Zn ribbon protein
MNYQPQTVTCPNCGAARPAGIAYCSNCGYTGIERKKTKPLVWVLLFAIVGVPAGCMGSCFLLMTNGGVTGQLGMTGIGILGLAIFVALLWMLIRSPKQ